MNGSLTLSLQKVSLDIVEPSGFMGKEVIAMSKPIPKHVCPDVLVAGRRLKEDAMRGS